MAYFLAVLLPYGVKPYGVKNVNTLATGASQEAGKTTTVLECDFKPVMEAGEQAIFFGDPQATGGEKGAAHTIEAGHEGRLIVLDLGREVFGSPGLFFRSKDANEFRRRRQNRVFAWAAAEVLSLHRSGSITDTRSIREWIFCAITAWQETELPPKELLNFLRPWTSSFDSNVTTLPEGDIKDKLKGLKPLWHNPAAWQSGAGAALRLLEETFNEPVFEEMLTPTFDLEEFIRHKGILIVLGGPEEFLNRLIIRLINYLITAVPWPSPAVFSSIS